MKVIHTKGGISSSLESSLSLQKTVIFTLIDGETTVPHNINGDVYGFNVKDPISGRIIPKPEGSVVDTNNFKITLVGTSITNAIITFDYTAL